MAFPVLLATYVLTGLDCNLERLYFEFYDPLFCIHCTGCHASWRIKGVSVLKLMSICILLKLNNRPWSSQIFIHSAPHYRHSLPCAVSSYDIWDAILKTQASNMFEKHAVYFLVVMKAQRDAGSVRILLVDNTEGGAVTLLPFSLQCVGL